MGEQMSQSKNCCFCIPLRRGLLAFGYTRLKSKKLYRISIVYAITLVCLMIAYQVYDVISVMCRLHWSWPLSISNQLAIKDLLLGNALFLLIESVQIYVVLLTRREMKKSRNLKRNMQFVNKMTEGEALCIHSDP